MAEGLAIRLRDVVKRYGDITAVGGFSLDVPEGTCVGLLGPNGAGKTTTMKTLTAQAIADEGEITVLGHVLPEDSKAARAKCGVVPQLDNLDVTLTTEQNLLVFSHLYRIPRAKRRDAIEWALDLANLKDRRDTRVDKLSGGMRRRLLIARALVHRPKLILLDEPTVGLDPQARRALWDILLALHRDGRTIVMTTHYMAEADHLCGRVAIIDYGKLLACDTPASLKAQAPGDTLIDLQLDGAADEAAVACRAVPGITRVDVTGNDLRAFCSRGTEALPSLIRVAEATGRLVRNINLDKPSLETLFVALTGRRLE